MLIKLAHIVLFLICLSKDESAGIAASIEAMAAGEDVPEVSGSGSKNAAESPSVSWPFCFSLYLQ